MKARVRVNSSTPFAEAKAQHSGAAPAPVDQALQPDEQRTHKRARAARELDRQLTELAGSAQLIVKRCEDPTVVNFECDRDDVAQDNRASKVARLSAEQVPPRPSTPPPTVGASALRWTESRRVLECDLRRLQEEQAAAGTAAAAEPVHRRSEELRLQQRLERLRLDMLVARADGNCQFRSVSQQLHDSEDNHPAIRKKAILYIQEHRGEFSQFLGGDFERYLRGMARPGTWGDELTLRALADALGVVINVVTSRPTNWYLKYAPARVTSETREIFLSYIAPVHYNSLRRRVDATRAEASAASSGEAQAGAANAAGAGAAAGGDAANAGATVGGDAANAAEAGAAVGGDAAAGERGAAAGGCDARDRARADRAAGGIAGDGACEDAPAAADGAALPLAVGAATAGGDGADPQPPLASEQAAAGAGGENARGGASRERQRPKRKAATKAVHKLAALAGKELRGSCRRRR